MTHQSICIAPAQTLKIKNPVRGFLTRLNKMYAVSRQRQALARLNTAQLDDVGIHPLDVKLEISRKFWDI